MQQDLLVFTDRKEQLIGDGDADITVVDGDGDENESPPKIKNKNDLNYQEDKEDFPTKKEDQTIQQPVKVKMDTLEEGPTIIAKVTEIREPHTIHKYMQPERSNEIPGVRKSPIVKFQTKQYYISWMKGSKYSVTVAHLKEHRALHPDVHMFLMKIKEEPIDVITDIMTQIQFNAELKEL